MSCVDSEVLYEDATFAHRELAALVASKVHMPNGFLAVCSTLQLAVIY